jgi:hypothetical protein
MLGFLGMYSLEAMLDANGGDLMSTVDIIEQMQVRKDHRSETPGRVANKRESRDIRPWTVPEHRNAPKSWTDHRTWHMKFEPCHVMDLRISVLLKSMYYLTNRNPLKAFKRHFPERCRPEGATDQGQAICCKD